MRIYIFLVLAMISFLRGAEPVKSFPLVELADGRVLKNVTLANPTKTTILLRPAGGASVLMRYEFLPDGVRDAAMALRPGGPEPKATTAQSVKPIELRGQIFVTTRGAGAYKFSGVKVYAFPAALFSSWENTLTTVELPLPLTRATTDGDGRFLLRVASGEPFFVFAQAERLVGGRPERHEWRVPASQISSGEVANLDSSNSEQWRRVKIEGEP